MTDDSVVGTWEITAMDAWDKPTLDLLGRACLEFEDDGRSGRIRFIAITGGLPSPRPARRRPRGRVLVGGRRAMRARVGFDRR